MLLVQRLVFLDWARCLCTYKLATCNIPLNEAHHSTLFDAPFSLLPTEVRALLLTDILVLLHKMEDGSERLLLKMYHVEGISGVRDEISPVIRLKEMLFRDRADRGEGEREREEGRERER